MKQKYRIQKIWKCREYDSSLELLILLTLFGDFFQRNDQSHIVHCLIKEKQNKK